MDKCKVSARYKNGFREGFNNPTQHEKFLDTVLIGNKIEHLKDEKTRGIVAGYLKRKQEIAQGKNEFIWSEKDLNERVC